MNKKGMLVIFSGPSGVGKDTVLQEVLKKSSDISLSVSLTTRPIRGAEVNGEDYYFVTREYFERKLSENGFLEYAEYGGNLYGTPKAPVDEMLSAGKNVILEIEVQGAEKIRKLYPDSIGIFVLPPSMSSLEKRLRGRGTDDEEGIQRRLNIAGEEIRRSVEYDYVVINDSIDEAADDIVSIIKAESFSTKRNKTTISEVINND